MCPIGHILIWSDIMDDIKAGVVIVSKFCKPQAKEFNNYIGYINRDEAIRNDNIEKYNLYQNYMGNPEKTTGLFTCDKSELSQEDKRRLKDAFALAQENGSLMWQNVISFDNNWLEKNGLYNSKEHILDETIIENLARKSMSVLQKKEELEDALWCGAIHYNTDNIHVHIAMVEVNPQRKMCTKGSGEGERRGKLKLGSLAAAKSSIVNQVINNQPENERINNIIRHNIIDNKKETSVFQDRLLAEQFIKIYATMPEDKRLWNYNSNAITQQRPEIDKLSNMFIERYHKDDLKELIEALDSQEQKYREAYGTNAKSSYKENKIQDLYYRLGNVILKEMKNYDTNEKRRIYEEKKKDKQKVSQSALKPINKSGRLRNATAKYNLTITIALLKESIEHAIESQKNQYQYELMIREAELAKIEE